MNSNWTPPAKLLESDLEFIVPACCLGLEDECEILATGSHIFDFMPNDIKLGLLVDGLERLEDYLDQHGWPDDDRQVVKTLEWLETYIANIQYLWRTGEFPQAVEQSFPSFRTAAGRNKGHR